MIRILKYSFLAIAIVVIVVLFIWQKDAGQIKLAAVNMAIEGDITAKSVEATKSTVTLEKPRYQGRDNNGQQWLISADRALQQGSMKAGTVTLIQANAQFSNTEDNTKLLFTAGNGVYTQASANASETLTLSDDVTVSGYGLTLKTEELSTRISTRDVTAPSAIHLAGNLSGMNLDLVAGGFQYTPIGHNGETLKLTGGLRARLTPLSKSTNP